MNHTQCLGHIRVSHSDTLTCGMIQLGSYNTLEVIVSTKFGLYLSDGQGNEVLLPNKYVPADAGIGTQIRVFVYRDSEQRPVATTLDPYITLGAFAALRVKSVTEFGAFLDWGLEKDLLCPHDEQAERMQLGKQYVVTLLLDEFSGRLMASSKLRAHLSNDVLTVAYGDEVDLLVIGHIEAGIQVAVNQKHLGLVYRNEVFRPMQPGMAMKGYIKTIRPENKLDISLQALGYRAIEPNAQKILDLLQSGTGFLPLHDGSDPELIASALQMSKKTFKKAIGSLYRDQQIRIAEDGIHLLR
jgi:uncharacterized protein